MAEIISDGVRSVTSDDTSSAVNGYGRFQGGYGYHENLPFHQSEWANERTRDLLSADAKTEIAVEKTGAATSLAIEKVGAAGVLENQKNAFALALQANLIEARRDVAAGFAAGALSAATNTAAIQAALAECCCELKELIREDGGKTRDLVSSIQASNLATQLVDTKLALAAALAKGNGQGNN